MQKIFSQVNQKNNFLLAEKTLPLKNKKENHKDSLLFGSQADCFPL